MENVVFPQVHCLNFEDSLFVCCCFLHMFKIEFHLSHSFLQVRRLRSRIDELKREVASAQDELDAATNNVR